MWGLVQIQAWHHWSRSEGCQSHGTGFLGSVLVEMMEQSQMVMPVAVRAGFEVEKMYRFQPRLSWMVKEATGMEIWLPFLDDLDRSLHPCLLFQR